jgi:hypothetical protein
MSLDGDERVRRNKPAIARTPVPNNNMLGGSSAGAGDRLELR